MKKFLLLLKKIYNKKWFKPFITVMSWIILAISFFFLITNILYPAISIDAGINIVYKNWFVLVGVFVPALSLVYSNIKNGASSEK